MSLAGPAQVVHASRFKYGLWPGIANAAVDTYVLRGNAPWTLRHRSGFASISCSISWLHALPLHMLARSICAGHTSDMDILRGVANV